MHAIRGWTIGCPSHNKDLYGAECGGGKTEIDPANLAHVTGNGERHYRITSHPMIVEHLSNHYQPKKSIFVQGGRGIYRRVIHYHDKNIDPINTTLPLVDAMAGSSQMFEFTDVGVPGQLMVRARPRHLCACCMRLEPSQCVNEAICGNP